LLQTLEISAVQRIAGLQDDDGDGRKCHARFGRIMPLADARERLNFMVAVGDLQATREAISKYGAGVNHDDDRLGSAGRHISSRTVERRRIRPTGSRVRTKPNSGRRVTTPDALRSPILVRRLRVKDRADLDWRRAALLERFDRTVTRKSTRTQMQQTA